MRRGTMLNTATAPKLSHTDGLTYKHAAPRQTVVSNEWDRDTTRARVANRDTARIVIGRSVPDSSVTARTLTPRTVMPVSKDRADGV